MSFSVNTNNEAMTAIRLLNMTKTQMSTTQERINSGLKVGGARDNASIFAIAQGMRGDVSSFKAIKDSLSLGKATTTVALKAAEQMSDTLNQIKSKITSAQEQNVDRAKIQEDITALVDQVETISQAAQFNGINLINGVDGDLKVLSSLNRADASSAPTAEYITVAATDLTTGAGGLNISGINVQNKTVELKFDNTFAVADNDTLEFKAGGKTYTFEFIDDPTATAPTDGDNIVVEYDAADSVGQVLAKLTAAMGSGNTGLSATYNGTGNLIVSSADGMDADATSAMTGFVSGTATAGGGTTTALTTIEDAITTLNSAMTSLASGANRLDAQETFMTALTDTLTSGVGNLVDADMAEESAKLQALQTKQQLGIQALSIANQQPGSIMSLFRQ